MDKCHKSGDKIFLGESYRDSTSSNSYKYPCRCNTESVQRRAKGQKLGFLVSRLDFLFFLFSREREAYIERDTDVPFLFSAFVFSNKGNYFSFVHCSDILFFFLFSFLFLCDLLWLLMNMQVDSKSKYN